MAKIKTNITIVFNSLDIGGIERKIIDLANYYQSRNVSVTLLLKHRTGQLLPLLAPTVTVAAPPLSPGFFSSLFFPLWLISRLLRISPDLVLSFGNYSSVCSATALLLTRRSCPHIISEDSSITTQLKTDSFSSLRTFLVKLLYPLADSIIVLTETSKSKLINTIPTLSSKIAILPNWLPLTIKVNKSSKTIDILFLGRFEPQKNPLLFLRLCRQLLKTKPGLKIAMYGQGSLLPDIKKYVARHHLDNISLHPAATSPGQVYSQSRLLLLTSAHEGFPLTILEAAAAGCLPVCNKLRELEHFFDKKPGLLLYRRSKDAIANTQFLINHPDHAHSLSGYYQTKVLTNQKACFNSTIKFLNQYL